MGRHQRCIRYLSHVPKTSLVEVGEIKHNAQAITGAHQGFPGICQSRAGVGRVRKLERYAMGEGVGPAPYYTKRTQPRLVENLERVQFRINGLCPLELHTPPHPTLPHTAHHLPPRAHNLSPPTHS